MKFLVSHGRIPPFGNTWICKNARTNWKRYIPILILYFFSFVHPFNFLPRPGNEVPAKSDKSAQGYPAGTSQTTRTIQQLLPRGEVDFLLLHICKTRRGLTSHVRFPSNLMCYYDLFFLFLAFSYTVPIHTHLQAFLRVLLEAWKLNP